MAGPPIEKVRFDELRQIDELVLAGMPPLVEVRLDALESATSIFLTGESLESVHFAELREVARLAIDSDRSLRA